jgi:hypothetical protein
MSPEQVAGHLQVDHRTDIYSLGMVLYALLTLARPIAAPSREAVLRQIVTKAMPPASWRNPSLPRDLEAVLHKATSKDPDDRYRTAAEFAADLRRWLDGNPVMALPYRYRLDAREIRAERPAGIMVIAFAHFLAAAFSAIAAAWMILVIVIVSSEQFKKSVGWPRAVEPSIQAVRFSIGVTGVGLAFASACFLEIGLGLLTANRWARWVSIGAYFTLAAWALFEMLYRLGC